MFFKIGVLENFANFTGKRLCSSLFSMKLQALRPATLLKTTPIQIFSCKTCELFKSNFFDRTPPVAASNITTYFKYTLPYLLNDLVYPWNSSDRVKIFPIIFVNLYSCIWTSVSSLLFQWLKNIFSFLHSPGLISPFSINPSFASF